MPLLFPPRGGNGSLIKPPDVIPSQEKKKKRPSTRFMRLTFSPNLIYTIFFFTSAVTEVCGTTPVTDAPGDDVCDTKRTSRKSVTPYEVGFSFRREWLADRGECPASSTSANPGDAQDVRSQIVSGLEDRSVPLGTAGSPSGEENNFVSFEEWKRIKIAEEGRDDEGSDHIVDTRSASRPEAETTDDVTRSDDLYQIHHEANLAQDSLISNVSAITETLSLVADDTSSSSFPIPLYTPSSKHSSHRYNYASPDCSARIHSSSPQTQHASSLLHKSRDRYMLTPCLSDEHWVVVELCDDIRVEAVELAVWEFFSGIVRDVRVSVNAEDDDEGAWREVGAFVGKNVRGTQVSEWAVAKPLTLRRFSPYQYRPLSTGSFV